MIRETAFPKYLVFILASLIFLSVNVAVAQAQEAKIEKEYTGTLTGCIQHHPENKAFPYWLKSDNSTYGVDFAGKADQKALLDELRGLRISLTGTIQEFAGGRQVIVLDQPLKRPAPSPALALAKKVIAREAGRFRYDSQYIAEEFLLGDGSDVFLVGFHDNMFDTWLYEIFSVKGSSYTITKPLASSSMTTPKYYDTTVSVVRNSDVLTLSTPYLWDGEGPVSQWTYENGKLSFDQVVPFMAINNKVTVSGFLLAGHSDQNFYLKSGNLVYSISCWGDYDEVKAWFAGRAGTWMVLSGRTDNHYDKPGFTPDPKIQPEQPGAVVAVSGKSVLHDGKPVFTSSEGATLFLREELRLANGEDLFLVGMATGKDDCPYLYKIVSVKNGVCTATDAFGNGNGKPWAYPWGEDAVTVTFNRFNPGKGYTETWTYKDGAVGKMRAEAPAPGTLPPTPEAAPPAPKQTSQEKPQEPVGLNFQWGQHPIDLARPECENACGGTTNCLEKCRSEQLKAWKKEMDRAYRALLSKAGTPKEKEALKLSQEQWLKFADAEEKYISEALAQESGTIWGIVYAVQLVDLYRKRAITLMCHAEMACVGCPGSDNCE